MYTLFRAENLGITLDFMLMQVSLPQNKPSYMREAKSTALYKFYPIVVACLLWGSRWTREQIVVFCDNSATVEIINEGCSKIPIINSLMRRLT